MFGPTVTDRIGKILVYKIKKELTNLFRNYRYDWVCYIYDMDIVQLRYGNNNRTKYCILVL